MKMSKPVYREACTEEPRRQIVANAGRENAVGVERVRSEKNPNIGYNVLTGKFEDVVAAGLVRQVIRSALQKGLINRRANAPAEVLISAAPAPLQKLDHHDQ